MRSFATAILMFGALVALCVAGFVGLLFLRDYDPCEYLDESDALDLSGDWYAVYDDYMSTDGPIDGIEIAMVSGEETISLMGEGRYVQQFESLEMTYRSSILRWEIIPDEVVGVKLRMFGLKYFGHGVRNVDVPRELYAQTRDFIQNSELGLVNSDISEDMSVVYLNEDFLYLYPRRCGGEIVLLQMTGSMRDPDRGLYMGEWFRRPE